MGPVYTCFLGFHSLICGQCTRCVRSQCVSLGGVPRVRQVIVRINGATTKGYEHDVGRQSSVDQPQIRVGWGQGPRSGLNDARRKGQLCCGVHVVATNQVQHHDGWWHPPSTLIRSEWMERARDVLKHEPTAPRMFIWPSTGFLAIAISLAVGQHIGASISVYGFGGCHGCNKYDDCDGSNTTAKGSVEAERDGLNAYHPWAQPASNIRFAYVCACIQ